MYSCDCGLLLNSTLWIEGHSSVENGYQHGEKAIGNAAKGAAVTVPGFSEALVMLAAARIELRADTRPVIQRVSQTPVARLPHDNGAFLPALSCNRRYPGVGSKRVVISLSESLRGFSEHRGSDYTTYPGQRQQEGHVTMLARRLRVGRSHFFEHGLNAFGNRRSLVMDQTEAR